MGVLVPGPACIEASPHGRVHSVLTASCVRVEEEHLGQGSPRTGPEPFDLGQGGIDGLGGFRQAKREALEVRRARFEAAAELEDRELALELSSLAREVAERVNAFETASMRNLWSEGGREERAA